MADVNAIADQLVGLTVKEVLKLQVEPNCKSLNSLKS